MRRMLEPGEDGLCHRPCVWQKEKGLAHSCRNKGQSNRGIRADNRACQSGGEFRPAVDCRHVAVPESRTTWQDGYPPFVIKCLARSMPSQ